MKKTMKILTIFTIITATAVLAGSLLFGQCGSSKAFYNGVDGSYNGLGAGDIAGCKFWMQSNSNPTNGAGIDNGTNTAWLALFGATYYLNGDWGNGGVDGCITTSTRMVAATFHENNPGAATHQGTFTLNSEVGNGFGVWDFDAAAWAGNCGSHCVTVIPYVASFGNAAAPTDMGGGNFVYHLRWNVPAMGERGWSSSVPSADLITGYNVYYASGADPATGNPASWTSLATVASANRAAGALITYDTPSMAINHATTAAYFAIRLTFDGAAPFQTPTVSAGAIILPQAAGIFGDVNGVGYQGHATANWSTNDETGVMGYNVWWSPTTAGTFRRANKTTIPAQGTSGANYSYNLTVRNTSLTSVAVKVEALKMDGTSEFSNVIIINLPGSSTGTR